MYLFVAGRHGANLGMVSLRPDLERDLKDAVRSQHHAAGYSSFRAESLSVVGSTFHNDSTDQLKCQNFYYAWNYKCILYGCLASFTVSFSPASISLEACQG